MKPFILIGFFVMIHSTVFSQKHISGKVISDEDGLGVPGVSIIVKGTTIGTATDINGNFTLNVPNDATIVVSFIGFKSVEMAVENQTQFNITIQPSFEDYYSSYYPFINIDVDECCFAFAFGPQIDDLNLSFNSFESILGKENVDNLNKLRSSFNFELAAWYRKFYFALNIGDQIPPISYSINDGKGKYKTFLLGTHFGYNIINSKELLITPKIGVKWYRYRMINSDSQHSIPIGQYIVDRDLDIRFNHLIGFTGINCSLKHNIDETASVLYGFYGGYAFKLNNKPWVHSGNNRLITDRKIDFSNFNFGVSISFFLNLY